LLLATGVAFGARFAARYTGPIPDVVIALVAGIAISATTHTQAVTRAGTGFVLRYLLRTAIILLGAGLTLAAIAQLGLATLGLVVACVAIAMLLGFGLAKLAHVEGRIGTLIGAGTAICGGSAILAIGPLIEATDAEIAYAVTTIFTFNIVALLLYPVLGHALGMSQVRFGSWAGTAVNDTSVVVATGYVFGKLSGATATVVKLTRTLFLLPLAFTLASASAVRGARRGGRGLKLRELSGAVPWFVFGFAAVVLVNSAHAIPPALATAMTQLASFLIVIVLAAVGLNVDLVKIRSMGLTPLAVGVALAATMAVVSLSLIHLFHIG
jgi:uncharacterized integral membrane protein (TIGR00698 family)